MIQDLYKAKRSLELQWEQEYLDNGKYTLDMVQIDNKIKEVIFEIKSEESRIATKRCCYFERRSRSFSSYLITSCIIEFRKFI
jgi:hypothetical protein